MKGEKSFSALKAIIARIEGEFDDKDLVSFGPLSTDTLKDVLAIAQEAIKVEKVKVRVITFSNWEGPIKVCGRKSPTSFPTWEDAQDFLRTLGSHNRHENDNFKVSFHILFDNDEEYTGRIDIKNGLGYDNMNHTLKEHVRRSIGFFACKVRPTSFTDAQWESHCKDMEKQGNKTEALKWLETYDI